MSTRISQLAWLECIWSQIAQGFVLQKFSPDYLMHINVDIFLSVISYKPFINLSLALRWKINKEKKSEPGCIPKTFAAPCFWFISLVSSILLLVTLLLTSLDHNIISQSQVTQALFMWVGVNFSESHSEQREGVVNVSLHCFVRIKLWLIVKTF